MDLALEEEGREEHQPPAQGGIRSEVALVFLIKSRGESCFLNSCAGEGIRHPHQPGTRRTLPLQGGET